MRVFSLRDWHEFSSNYPKMVKLLSLINENLPLLLICQSKSDMYNVTLEWIIDSSANQHMTDSTRNMFNVVDISSLMIIVGHPNGKIVGTGSESGGLYLFDLNEIGKSVNAKCNKLGFSKRDNLSPCDIYHKAKQTRESFHLSDHKTKSVGYPPQSCMVFPFVFSYKSEEHNLNFFDVQSPIRPYDEKGDTYNVDGNIGVNSDGCNITVEDEVAGVAAQIDDNVTSE
ncbi:hypothetical protein Tco_1297801, partial [Tanacetum coccineum]